MHNIMDKYTTLTVSEKICFGHLQSLGIKVTTMTLEELSQQCNVSTATINRTLKKLGFANFKAYKQVYIQLATPTHTDTKFEQVIKQELDHELEDYSKLIRQSPHIYIVAFGITSSLALDFAMHLKDINISCEIITDSDILSTIKQNNTTLEKSLIIYITYSGGDIDMQRLSIDSRYKFNQLLITCTTNSILSTTCDHQICTNTYNKDKDLKSRIPLYIVVMKLLKQLDERF